MTFVYIILLLSLLFNILVLITDTIPFLYPKIKRRLFKEKTAQWSSQQSLEQAVVARAIDMSQSEKVVTIWGAPSGFTQRMFNLFTTRKNDKFTLYHYPRAYLFYGLSEYFKVNRDNRLDNLRNVFDQFMFDKGELRYKLTIADQAPFGLTALNFYYHYQDKKYEVLTDRIYQDVIIDNLNDKGLIEYRKGQTNFLCDTLGMVVPFLVEYHRLRPDSEALAIAKRHVDYYIQNGIDSKTLIPAHGIEIASNNKGGSINWGRGIGWYLLALSKMYAVTGAYQNEFAGIIQQSFSNDIQWWAKAQNQIVAQIPTKLIISWTRKIISMHKVSKRRGNSLNRATFIK